MSDAPKWEYRSVYLKFLGGGVKADVMDAAFNKLGGDGWELVSVSADYAFFKRGAQ
jgi:hypothetical protein